MRSGEIEREKTKIINNYIRLCRLVIISVLGNEFFRVVYERRNLM